MLAKIASQCEQLPSPATIGARFVSLLIVASLASCDSQESPATPKSRTTTVAGTQEPRPMHGSPIVTNAEDSNGKIDSEEPSDANPSGAASEPAEIIAIDHPRSIDQDVFDPVWGLDTREARHSPPVSEVIDNIRTALASRDMFTAGAMLNKARVEFEVVGLSSAEIERIAIVYRCLVKFWAAVRQRSRSLQRGDHLPFAGRVGTVVTFDDGTVVLRYENGQQAEMSLVRADMSADLATALVASQLSKSGPVAGRVIAAFHACDEQGNPSLAAAMCREMYLAGLDVDVLLPEL